MQIQQMIGYPCATCRREGSEVTLHIGNKPMVQFCCIECARLYMTKNLTASEEAAAAKGGEEAGAYLDKIGKTDLARLTGEEWAQFCQTLFVASCAELRRMADDCVPF